MGNIISVNENGKQHYKYSYDKLNRLISEKDLYSNEELCYTYDNNGNILTRSEKGTVIDYKYADGTDRLMKFGNQSFVYDSMGNPTTYRNMTCVWGNGRQLKSITNGTDTAFYTYDEFGVRTKKINGGITTNYVYENGKLLREITGSEKIDFIYGAEGAMGFRIGESYYIYHKNIFGDVTEIYDASGALVGKYSYTAFGECIVKVNEGGIAEKNPIRYRGYYYDTETGLYYLKSRYYDPELGRFMTIDGIEYIDPDTINGLNLYAYCGNNPVNYCDPDGCLAMPSWLKWVIGGVVIVGLGIATVFTGGAAGVILGAAFYGAVTGAVGGALVNGLIGGIASAISGDGFWSGFGDGAADGFMFGAIIGGISGALLSGINIATGGVKIVGTAQKTGSLFHQFASNVQAGKMSMAIGRYSEIHLNRSKGLGIKGFRPDVTGVTKNGLRVVEVVSSTQTYSSQVAKVATMMGRYSHILHGLVLDGLHLLLNWFVF